MSDPEPIDLSQLQNLNLAPDWVGDLQKRDTAPGEVVWGRAPDSGSGGSHGGGGGGPRGFGGKGPRRDGGGFGGGGGGRGDFNSRGPGGPRGPRQDDRGPRPGGGGGGGGFGGPRPQGGGGGQGGFGGPRPQGGGGFGGPRGDGAPRGPRPDRPQGDGPRGPRPEGRGGPRPGGDRREGGFGGGDRREGGGGGGRGDFRGGRGGHFHGGHGRFDDRPHIEPLPGWNVRLFAEPRSLEAIVRQIKASGRAYPVFELGRLFLAGRDRYVVSFARQAAPAPKRPAKAGEPVPETPPLEGPDEIFQVTADSSLWLTRDEAIRHVLHGGAAQHFYRRETVAVDPPKGNFTAVAVCGFSGEILGPPNHHSFQSTVARLHREKFSNLPLDRYKSRIRTEKSEELVAKWLESQSTTVVYIPLTAAEREAAAKAKADAEAGKTAPAAEAPPAAPAEETPSAETPAAETESPATDEPATAPPAGATEAEAPAAGAPEENAAAAAASASEEIPEEFVKEPGNEAAATHAPEETVTPLKSQAEMEAHFLQHHAAGAVKAVTRAKVPGNIPGKLLAPPLLALLRQEVEQQQRFPMQLVQDLCRDLEKQSLKFFKRDRKATFVSRTRPHWISDESHLSPRLRSIIGVVRANPGITHPRLVSTLAPHVAKVSEIATETAAAPAPAPAAAAAEETPAAGTPAPEAAAAAVAAEPAAFAETTEAPVTETASPENAEAPAAEITPDAGAAAASGESAPVVEAVSAETAAADAVEAAPSDTEVTAAPVEPAGAEEPGTPVEAVIEPAAGETGSENASGTEEITSAAAEAPQAGPAVSALPAAAAEAAPVQHHLTAEEIAVLQDLRWLVQEGFVTEFATGELQILGRPPQPAPEKKPKAPAEKKDKTPAQGKDPEAAGEAAPGTETTGEAESTAEGGIKAVEAESAAASEAESPADAEAGAAAPESEAAPESSTSDEAK